MQRISDFIISLVAILVLSPLLAPLIIILRFTGEGEVFFSQLRVGKNEKLFRLYKFATMLKESPNIGTGTLTVSNDPRVLPFGKFLRKTKVNELPQIFNILKGDISLVGPRPQSPRNFAVFPNDSKVIIGKVSPGLTGIGSIVFSNEEEILAAATDPDDYYDSVIMPYKAALEIWYVNQSNALTNIKIITITMIKILFPWFKIDFWTVFDGLPALPQELIGMRRK